MMETDAVVWNLGIEVAGGHAGNEFYLRGGYDSGSDSVKVTGGGYRHDGRKREIAKEKREQKQLDRKNAEEQAKIEVEKRNAEASGLDSGDFALPVDGQELVITSGYSTEPTELRDGRAHLAVDIRNSEGESVYAIEGGTVYVGSSDNGTNYVTITDTETGNTFAYSHVKNTESLKNGDIVKPGQKIGSTDLSGKSDGAHIHLQIRTGRGRNEGAYDPIKYFDKYNIPYRYK